MANVFAFSQYTLHIKLRSLAVLHNADDIFIAGSFNGWDPGNKKYKLVRLGDNLLIDIPGLKENVYEFKFTRGDWKKVEVTKKGVGIANRLIKLSNDTTLDVSIQAWSDDFKVNEKQHTSSPNVHLMDSAFFIPQLYRTRRIWIYLPPGYAESAKKYPVLYMHDGQNLFDDYTSGYGEWGVDECIDSLINRGRPGCIVVGIESGPRRMNEYNPYNFKDVGNGEGEEYVLFIVETLNPFIDKHYRTLSSKENTMIAGSSMGGLISYYAMLRYPDVFGKAGIFSPSFWIAPQIKLMTDSLCEKIKSRFFFYAGEAESDSMVPDMYAVTDKLGENSESLIYTVTDPAGRHNEQTWRKWFEEFYLWIMGDGLNTQVKTGN